MRKKIKIIFNVIIGVYDDIIARPCDSSDEVEDDQDYL